MKRIVLSIVIFTLLLPVSTVFAASYKTVKDIESGIQMTYNYSDYIQVDPNHTAVFSFFHKKDHAPTPYFTGISINLEKFAGYKSAQDAISKDELSSASKWPDVKSVKGNKVNIPISKDASELILTLKNGMIQRELWFQVDGRFYRIIMTAPKKYYDQVKKDVDEIIKTLKLTHPLSVIESRENYIKASDFPESDSSIYSVGEEFEIPNSSSKVIVKQVLRGEEALAKAKQLYVYTTVPKGEEIIAVEVEFNLHNYEETSNYPLLLEPHVTQYTKKSDKKRMLQFGFSDEYPFEFQVPAGEWLRYSGWYIMSTDKDFDTYMVFTEQYASTSSQFHFSSINGLKRLWVKL